MKGILVLLALAAVLLSGQLYAHHAAEGIISDELWSQIDTMLEGSPHLDLDFDDPGCADPVRGVGRSGVVHTGLLGIVFAGCQAERNCAEPGWILS